MGLIGVSYNGVVTVANYSLLLAPKESDDDEVPVDLKRDDRRWATLAIASNATRRVRDLSRLHHLHTHMGPGRPF